MDLVLSIFAREGKSFSSGFSSTSNHQKVLQCRWGVTFRSQHHRRRSVTVEQICNSGALMNSESAEPTDLNSPVVYFCVVLSNQAWNIIGIQEARLWCHSLLSCVLLCDMKTLQGYLWNVTLFSPFSIGSENNILMKQMTKMQQKIIVIE